jgi:hypothetical protein
VSVLACIPLWGHSKDYIVAKFFEMAKRCIFPIEDVHPVLFGDRSDIASVHNLEIQFFRDVGGRQYAEDVCLIAKNMALTYATENKYDKCIWLGVDCLFQTKEDFQELLNLCTVKVPIVAPLTSSRLDPSEAVCRMFLHVDGVPTEEQYDIPDYALWSESLVQVGFPSSDALAIHKSAFGVRVKEHIPWYERVEKGMPNVCGEEAWCLQALRQGFTLHCATWLKVWHANDTDGVARMWPDISVPTITLHW